MLVDLDSIEYRILEVPDYVRLYAKWSLTAQHLDYLRGKAEDRGKRGGVTLGAYRRARYWSSIPAILEVWSPCARQEIATGVPWPHCLFKRIVGRRGHAEDGSIYCPECRKDSPWTKRQRTEAPKIKPQLSLF